MANLKEQRKRLRELSALETCMSLMSKKRDELEGKVLSEYDHKEHERLTEEWNECCDQLEILEDLYDRKVADFAIINNDL